MMESSGSNDAYAGRIIVGEATKEWSLRVDEKLAHRLQEEEISKHLDGNRHRNEILRQSYPVAASLQQMAVEEANSIMQQRIDADARIAKEQQKMELQKASARIKDLKSKKVITKQLPPVPDMYEAGPSTSQCVMSPGQSNGGAVPRRLPPKPAPKSHSFDAGSGSGFNDNRGREYMNTDNNLNLAELEAALGVSKEELSLEKERLLQEEKDAELARQLSNTELKDPVEIADSELARRLQDREYERYQKSKEKRALRKQMEKMNSSRATYEDNSTHILSDTYSQPHDSLKDTSPSNNNLGNRFHEPPSYSQNNGHHTSGDSTQQEDPYYMEPIHASDPFLTRLNIHNNNGDYSTEIDGNLPTSSSLHAHSKQYNNNVMINSSHGSSTEYKRAPPAPPKNHGKPRMADPAPHTGSLKSNDDKDRNKARCRQM